jgi:hypothetical protein
LVSDAHERQTSGSHVSSDRRHADATKPGKLYDSDERRQLTIPEQGIYLFVGHIIDATVIGRRNR